MGGMVMKISMIRLHGAVLVAVLLISAVEALAQKPAAAAQEVSESFTVEAIDHASRVVTLKDKAGLLEDVYCGPDVQRFDALKVGDTVTFRYFESVVTALRRAGAAAPPAQGATVTRTPGTAPGGTIAQELTATVTIEAIDAKGAFGHHQDRCRPPLVVPRGGREEPRGIQGG